MYAKYQVDMADYFKLLSNPARIKILELLQDGENLSTSDLAYHLPLGRTTVFQHIKVLKDAGWILSGSNGYSLNRDLLKENLIDINRFIKNIYNLMSITSREVKNYNLSKILFLCTENSCRSQMAQGFFNAYRGNREIVAESAGTKPSRMINPLAIQVMKEKGIDLTDQKPKSLDIFKGDSSVDLVAYVCTMAEKDCPYLFPFSRQKISIPFDDPSKFRGSKEETLSEFRRVRDEIEVRIKEFLEEIPE